MSSSYRMELDAWISQLHVSADTVIDIGGSQEPAKGRTATWDVKNYYIGDLEYPHKDSPQPDFIVDLNGYTDTKLKADILFCLEVFDYVYDPMNAFHIISNMLNPGGVAYITFPFVYPLHQPIEDDALRYTIGAIGKLAEATGMNINHYTIRRPETNLLQQFYSAERMRAAKGEDHAVTGWIVKLVKQ